MKFVIAPDKFKGSLTGFEFCDGVEKGLRMVFKDAEIIKMPLADGGDGTIEVVRHYLNGNTCKKTVNNPLFHAVEASYLFSKDAKTAYIEMAEASGLKLLQENEKNCLLTTSLGTGELILDAIERRAKEVILGIGGSATNDAGMGLATALGYVFLDREGNPLLPIGKNLIKVKKIDASQVDVRLEQLKVRLACDVTNPLYGERGAAHVYAKQKGASKEDIAVLDEGLRNFAEVIDRQFDINLQNLSGAGAAGGIGGGASFFLNASLSSGIELIQELADFDSQIKDAAWIITGEGKLDGQTLSGKTIQAVLTSAQKQAIPVAALCGTVDLSLADQRNLGLAYAVSILKGVSNLEQALDASYENLVYSAFNFASILKHR